MRPTYVIICFYNDENKILIQNRKSINKYNSEWGLFGGHLENNETALQAIIRETKEELDIDLNKQNLIYIATVRTPVGEVYTSIFLFKLNIELKDINLKEGDGFKLVSKDKCAELELHPGDVFRTKLIFNFLELKS